jgi:lysyl-tRNA synthetase class 2
MLSTAVESTTLSAVAYQPADQVLCLEFRSRAVYCYFGVPLSVYQDLLAADSKGSYFNRYIRGRFPYHRLIDDQPPSQA